MASIAGLQADYAKISRHRSLKIKGTQTTFWAYFIEVTATHAGKHAFHRPCPRHSRSPDHRQRGCVFTTKGPEPSSRQGSFRRRTKLFRWESVSILPSSSKGFWMPVSRCSSLGQNGDWRSSIFHGSCPARRIRRLVQTLVDDSAPSSGRRVASGWVRSRTGSRGRNGSFRKRLGALPDGVPTGADIWLVTRPEHWPAKSTFPRQKRADRRCSRQSWAQLFVPAARARIGVVTRLFSRVGAADDLARGRSTFMVEMVETAAILNQADARSLVILDEIGRGTATYDGLSIAWATLEHLHEVNGTRALFATHYHELGSLTARLDGVKAAHVAAKEWEDDVVFLHEVRAGSADRSYGVQVARLAGLPDAVIARARSILASLEESERGGTKALVDDLPLFSSAPAPEPVKPSMAESILRHVNPDDLTPREALDLVYRLKKETR